MLNIDFSFLKSSELDSAVEDIAFKYNELYKSKVVHNIKEIDGHIPYDSDIDLSITTEEIDLRNIIEVNCKGTIGRHY
jgi:hypothetical protein